MPALHRILVVDDDRDLLATLTEQLDLCEEFETVSAEDGTEAIRKAGASHFDLVIMDGGLPDMHGRHAVQAMRLNGLKSPILMLSGQSSDAETIAGLEAGADDYIHKPFKFSVLLARIRAQIRQHASNRDAVFRIGEYSFLPGEKLLVHEKGNRVRLTEKEASILRFLHRAGEKVVSRVTLLTEVWGYNAGADTHTLETHIYRLRQKFEANPSKARILVTEPGGYKLVP